MPRFTVDDLARITASQGYRVLSVPANAKSQGAIVERPARNGPLAAKKGEAGDTARFLVRVTSFRRRLLDIDNLSCKYAVDCCRYAGLIPDDNPAVTKIEVSQEKVKSAGDERTEVEIHRLQ